MANRTYSVKGNRTAADVVAGREEIVETGYTLEEAKIAAIEIQKTSEFVASWIEEEEAKASPRFNGAKLAAVVAIAKSKTSDRRWLNAIDRAAAALTSNCWIVTELADAIAVTTESGRTYFANGTCQCKAFELGQPCKHRAAARLIEMYNAAPASKPVRPAVAPREPRITRSIERDVVTGTRVKVVLCDGWAI
jgi:SWIM zinc finger